MPIEAVRALRPSPSPYILKVASSGRRMEMVLFDAEYIRRLIERDPETEQHFSCYFGELIWLKLRSRVRSAQLLEDVRQETLLRVLKNLRGGGLDHPERLGAYVHSVCHNVMLEAFRSESRFQEIGDEGAAMIDPRAGAEHAVVTEERKNQVRAVLKELPEKDRALLQAVFIEEHDKDEVCRRYGVDRAYLRVLLHRARLKFRAVFSESYMTAR